MLRSVLIYADIDERKEQILIILLILALNNIILLRFCGQNS